MLAFSAPADSSTKKPGLCLLLHDVTERGTGRTSGAEDVRDDGGNVVARQTGPRTFALGFLATATGGDHQAQHQLLGSLLQALVDYDHVPLDYVPGDYDHAGRGIGIEIGELDRAPDLFSTFDLGARAALNLIAVAPVVPRPNTEIGPPAREIDLEVVKLGPSTTGVETAGISGIPDDVARRWTAVRVRERLESDEAPTSRATPKPNAATSKTKSAQEMNSCLR